MLFNILDLVYTKLFYFQNVLFNIFVKDKRTIETNDYICPDYIGDETTITKNLYCEYDMKEYNNWNCINFIMFFFTINLFYICLFLFIEASFNVFNNVIKNLFLKDIHLNKENYNINYYNINKENTEVPEQENIYENKDNKLRDKDIMDIEEFFYNYSEIIKIQQFLNKDNNLDKILYYIFIKIQQISYNKQ